MRLLINKKSKEDNYMDYVPMYNPLFPYTVREDGRVQVTVTNKGVFHRIAQLFLGRPEYSYIELDEFGTFIWQQIDGKRSIYVICMLVRDRFGRQAEPLFERAVIFFQILRKNAFILYVNKG